MARRDGQIIARGNGRWLVRWHLGENKHRSKVIHGTKRDAQRYLNGVLQSRDAGTYVEPSKRILDDYLDEWLKLAVDRKLAPKTASSYRWLLKKYVRPELGGRHLQSLEPLDLQRLVDGMHARGLSPRTIRLASTVLGAALKRAVRWRLLVTNPAEHVEIPRRVHHEMRALSRAEVARFREAAVGKRHALLFEFLIATGARPGEALALRWAQIDRQEGSVLILGTKTASSRRTVPLTSAISRALSAHRREQAEAAIGLGAKYDRDADLVFANAHGGPLDERSVARAFKRRLEAAKLPAARLYDLRHTHATLLIEAGANPKVVAERLGHTSIRTTLEVYFHVQPGMQEAATRVLEDLLD